MTGKWTASGTEIAAKKLTNDLLAGDDSINEQSLAMCWQIPRTVIATIRKSRLREHWHWRYGPSKNHGDVRITREGLAEIKKWLVPPEKVVPPEAPASVLENVPDATSSIPPLPENILVVWRIPANPRMLVALDAHGTRVSVRVTSNLKFRRGMKLEIGTQAVRIELWPGVERTPVYAFKGKYPRFYGRW